MISTDAIRVSEILRYPDYSEGREVTSRRLITKDFKTSCFLWKVSCFLLSGKTFCFAFSLRLFRDSHVLTNVVNDFECFLLTYTFCSLLLRSNRFHSLSRPGPRHFCHAAAFNLILYIGCPSSEKLSWRFWFWLLKRIKSYRYLLGGQWWGHSWLRRSKGVLWLEKFSHRANSS